VRDFLKGVLKFVAFIAVLGGIAVGVLYAFFVEVIDIGHSGMAPTLITGDRVVVWKTRDFEIGEVALCPHPIEPGRFVIGRVVGHAGTNIDFQRGQLLINGRTPDVDVLGTVSFDDPETGRSERMRLFMEDVLDHEHMSFVRERSEARMRRPQRVGSGIFLLGDNRTHVGEDSRTFGTVPPNTCIGRIAMRLSAAPSPMEVGNGALDLIE
jgi:signal peptidase I